MYMYCFAASPLDKEKENMLGQVSRESKQPQRAIVVSINDQHKVISSSSSASQLLEVSSACACRFAARSRSRLLPKRVPIAPFIWNTSCPSGLCRTSFSSSSSIHCDQSMVMLASRSPSVSRSHRTMASFWSTSRTLWSVAIHLR